MIGTTTVVSLYAGPGAGKSTAAAYLYSKLSANGISVELVSEYAKTWAWEGRPIKPYDQIYILAKQLRSESSLLGKVDVVVTDSPVWLALCYVERYAPECIQEGCRALAQSYYNQAILDGHHFLHLEVERTVPYAQNGRYETEEQAKEIDEAVRALLAGVGAPVQQITNDFDCLDAMAIEITTAIEAVRRCDELDAGEATTVGLQEALRKLRS